MKNPIKTILQRYTFFSRKSPFDMERDEFGVWAEGQAAKFLRKRGMKILARNYGMGQGELDIVARDREMIVFVEVKAGTFFGGNPETKVNRDKQKRMILAARNFIGRLNLHDRPARFDIITVKCDPNGQPVFEHEEDAFQA
jgi:putative endonuclease